MTLSVIASAYAGPIEDATEVHDASVAYSKGDYPTAARLYRPLAEKGNAYAQMALALLYKSGLGVPQNYVEAARLYRVMADKGYSGAQYFLGLLYEDGHGVPQDYVLAHMWLNLSAATGTMPGAAESRDNLKKMMSPAQIEEAQKLAREWKPTPEAISK